MTTRKLKTWKHGKQLVLGYDPFHPALKNTGSHPLVTTFVHPDKAVPVAEVFLGAFEALEQIAAMKEPTSLDEARAVAQSALAKLLRVMT